jgi:hypothetical protein
MPTLKAQRWLIAVGIIAGVAFVIVAIIAVAMHADTGSSPSGYPTCPHGQYWADKYSMCWPPQMPTGANTP